MQSRVKTSIRVGLSLSESSFTMEDRTTLLEIFPAEVWVKIMDNIHDPDILVNFCEASTFWKQLLESKKIIYLLPQVLKILVTHNFLTEDEEGYKDILRLRLGCKGWKNAVRYQLETPRQDYFSEYHLNAVEDLVFATRLRMYKCDIRELEEKITEPAQSTHLHPEENPFPVRFLEILEYRLYSTMSFEWYGYEGMNPYRQSAEQFLEKAGKHFWHTWIVAGFSKSPLEWYALMCRYTELMPNLKSLQLCSPPFNDKHRLTLDQLLHAPTFTTLRNLKRLCLEYVPTSAMNSILTANKHIQVLLIPTRPHSVAEEDPNQLLSLDCIKDVKIFSVSFKSDLEFHRIPENWNLRVLRIEFVPGSNCLDLSVLFMKLECFKKTLKVLYLNLPKTTHKNDRDNVWKYSMNPLQLPYLETLELKFCNFLSLDFLMGLLSLKNLYLRFDDNDALFPPCWDTLTTDKLFFDCDVTSQFMKFGIWKTNPTLEAVELIKGWGPTQVFRCT